MRWQSVDWIYLAQESNKCRAVINTVMNVRVHNIKEDCCLAE